MGDLSPHFDRSEFECSCGCGTVVADYKLVELAEEIRDYIGVPMVVHCCNRCLEHNKTIPGSKDTSQHVKFLAMDFHLHGVANKNLGFINHLDKLIGDRGALGVYDWGYHIDVRGKKARW